MSYDARLLQDVQRELVVRPDGVFGNVTLEAMAKHLGVHKGPEKPAGWPYDRYAEMEAFYGPHGDASALVKIAPAYQLFYDGKPMRTISVHRKIARAVEHVLNEVLRHYGTAAIQQLKLDVYDGCFNDRPKRGGSGWSTHAYGAALDFYAEENELHWDHTKAAFAQPVYAGWWAAWESVGAVSLGRERDFDWMHVQFAKLPE